MGADRSGFPKALKRLFDQMDTYAKGAPIVADAATGIMTFSGVAVTTQTVTIGARTYTWKTALTSPEVANEVLIGADQDTALTNLTSAIMGAGTAGTDYSSNTPVHSEVTAVADTSANTLTVTAKVKGSAGNSIVTTETGTNTAWEFATLNGGGSVKAQDIGHGRYRSLKLTLDQLHVAIVDEAGVVAYGGKKIYDFAQGLLKFDTATSNLTATKVSVSNTEIIAAWDGDYGLGTVTASNNATLATTEQNILPTTATPQAVAGATTAKGQNTAAAFIDGTATAVDLYLNQLIDDSDHNVGTTHAWIKFSGTIIINYVDGGDY